MGLFARLFNAPPPAPAPAAQPAAGPLVVMEEAFGNPDLQAAIDRIDNPPPNHRLDEAHRRVMQAFDDPELQRRMVAALRRLLHEGNPARGGSEP